MTPNLSHLDPVIQLLAELCEVQGYHKDDPKDRGPGEREIAELVAAKLRAFSWLTVTIEHVLDGKGNERPGYFNVLAFDGPLEETEFIAVGHLDTVIPSTGWTKPEYEVTDERFYALGAVDTRGGIAGMLDALDHVGPTKGVGYLFYSDEERFFRGMQDFVRRHPEVAPTHGISVCGGKGEAYVGWRACSEFEVQINGTSAHASRPHDGTNAAEALAVVMEGMRRACMEAPTENKTAANIAAVQAGSCSPAAEPYELGTHLAPPMAFPANKVANIGWGLLDVRPGGSEVSAAFVEGAAREALARFNEGRIRPATMEFNVNFEMPAYKGNLEKMDWLIDVFEPVHHGVMKDPNQTGFIDVTLIADLHDTQFMCLSPEGGNEHSADEFVTVEGLICYRDACVELLRRYVP